MKIIEKIEKNSSLLILFLILIIFLKQCGVSREQNKITKRLDSLEKKISNVPTKKELEIQGIVICKRTLYDWNSVVRTSVRPDDRMNEYDQEIKKLENLNEK